MDAKPIEEKLLGECILAIKFNAASIGEDLPDYQIQWYRMTIYDCPADRRCIVKDVSAVWNPPEFDGEEEPDQQGSGAVAGDARVMDIKANRMSLGQLGASDTDVPDALRIPNLTGGHASSIVLMPGEKLEIAIKIDKAGVLASEDYLIVRANGVEVMLT